MQLKFENAMMREVGCPRIITILTTIPRWQQQQHLVQRWIL